MQIETPSPNEKQKAGQPEPPKKSSLMMNTKRAREFAFLGMYEEATKSYEEAMAELKSRRAGCRNRPELLEVYRSLEKDLMQETVQVKTIWDMITTGVLPKVPEPPARNFESERGGSEGGNQGNGDARRYAPADFQKRPVQGQLPSVSEQQQPQQYAQNNYAPQPISRPRPINNDPLSRQKIQSESFNQPNDQQDRKLPFNTPPFVFHHMNSEGNDFPQQMRQFKSNDDIKHNNSQGRRPLPNRGSNQRIPTNPQNVLDQRRNNSFNQYGQLQAANFSDQFGAVDLQQRVVTPIDFDHVSRQVTEQQKQPDPPGIPGLRNQYPPGWNDPKSGKGGAPFKDPDVWDPPSPRQGNKPLPPARNAPNFKKQPIAPPSGGQPKSKPEIDSQGGRNYSRPWMNGVPAPKTKTDAQTAEESRYKFLYHHYPDGKGPDSDLIRMLEDTIVTTNLHVTFDDIAGLEDAKENLNMYVVMALHMRDFFKNIRAPPKGILLFGPPGTGKTMLAKAIATTGKTCFLNVNPSSIASKWRGDSEKMVRILFEMARFYAPSTIFIDEIDSLLSERSSSEHESSRKVKTQFFTEIDGVVSSAEADDSPQNRVFILAATNRPWDLDEAILRRLTKRIYIPLPNAESRRTMIQMKLKDIKLSEDVDIDYLVKNTEKYNSSDINSLCSEASMAPFRRRQKQIITMQETQQLKDLQAEMLNEQITMEDFLNALKKVKPSASDKHTAQYEEWMREHGSN